VRHHFVIDKLVAHRDLGGAVEGDQAAEAVGIDDDQPLMRGGGIEQNLRHPVFGANPSASCRVSRYQIEPSGRRVRLSLPLTDCLDRSRALAAQMLGEANLPRAENPLQHADAELGSGIAAHEHIEGGIAALRPGVDRRWLSASTATPETPELGVKWCRCMCRSVAPAVRTHSRKVRSISSMSSR
jgi:hypothetical protein